MDSVVRNTMQRIWNCFQPEMEHDKEKASVTQSCHDENRAAMSTSFRDEDLLANFEIVTHQCVTDDSDDELLDSFEIVTHESVAEEMDQHSKEITEDPLPDQRMKLKETSELRRLLLSKTRQLRPDEPRARFPHQYLADETDQRTFPSTKPSSSTLDERRLKMNNLPPHN